MKNLGNALQYLREEYSGTKLRLMELEQAISVIESLNKIGLSDSSRRPKGKAAGVFAGTALTGKALHASVRKRSPEHRPERRPVSFLPAPQYPQPAVEGSRPSNGVE